MIIADVLALASAAAWLTDNIYIELHRYSALITFPACCGMSESTTRKSLQLRQQSQRTRIHGPSTGCFRRTLLVAQPHGSSSLLVLPNMTAQIDETE